jgi:hypothetical protein
MNINPPTASRPAPPEVAPIDYKCIRYQQDWESFRHGGEDGAGYLVAIDPATNTRLWMLKVYSTSPKSPDAPTGGEEVFFGSMPLGPAEDELTIETEFGTRYLVNLKDRTSTLILTPGHVKGEKKNDCSTCQTFHRCTSQHGLNGGEYTWIGRFGRVSLPKDAH